MPKNSLEDINRISILFVHSRTTHVRIWTEIQCLPVYLTPRFALQYNKGDRTDAKPNREFKATKFFLFFQ